MQLGRQKWLNGLAYEVTHKTCLYSDSVSRKGKEQPLAPVIPMALQGITSTGMAEGTGVAGLDFQPRFLRISSRASVLV